MLEWITDTYLWGMWNPAADVLRKLSPPLIMPLAGFTGRQFAPVVAAE